MSYSLNAPSNAAFVGQAASTSTATTIVLPTGSTAAANFYANGVLRFLTGANAGQEQVIASNTAAQFVTGEFSTPPAEGDVFAVILGTPAAGASVDLVPMTQIASQAAVTDFASLTAPFSGTATIQISLGSTSLVNLSATPSGGSTATVSALNMGAEIGGGQWETLQFAMSAGATYALQVADAQTSPLAVSIEGVNK